MSFFSGITKLVHDAFRMDQKLATTLLFFGQKLTSTKNYSSLHQLF